MNLAVALVAASAGDLAAPGEAIDRGLSLGFAGGRDAALGAVGEVLETITREARADPWGAYWAMDVATGAAVGLCAFKWAPDATQAVEIAYYTFPALEGRGLGKAMAGALVEVARRGAARAVVAHTLPEENASCAILRGRGFAWLGLTEDPEDGQVWAWRLDLA